MGKFFMNIIMLAAAVVVLAMMYHARDAIIGFFRCMAMGVACGM